VNFLVAVNNFGDTRSGGLAGPMGLFIIVLMAIAVVLLIRNMNKRVRRLPDSFPDPADVRRDEEIARLDAELGRPVARPDRGRVDGDRSGMPTEAAKPEVTGAETTERPGADEFGDGRA
jgi:hypothetical protein